MSIIDLAGKFCIIPFEIEPAGYYSCKDGSETPTHAGSPQRLCSMLTIKDFDTAS